jgi:DNA-binding transcriptional ArsR family regulator
LERWEDAFGGYSSLYSAALLDNNKFLAVVGMMRSAYKGHRWSAAIENADKLMYDTRTEKGLAVEAEFLKAKSYLATSRRNEAFAILERLAKSGPMGVTELSARLKLSKGTVHRMLSTLSALGYVAKDKQSDKYFLTVKFLRLSSAMLKHSDIRSQVRPVLEELSQRSGETVHFVKRDGNNINGFYRSKGPKSTGGPNMMVSPSTHMHFRGKLTTNKNGEKVYRVFVYPQLTQIFMLLLTFVFSIAFSMNFEKTYIYVGVFLVVFLWTLADTISLTGRVKKEFVKFMD